MFQVEILKLVTADYKPCERRKKNKEKQELIGLTMSAFSALIQWDSPFTADTKYSVNHIKGGYK